MNSFGSFFGYSSVYRKSAMVLSIFVCLGPMDDLIWTRGSQVAGWSCSTAGRLPVVLRFPRLRLSAQPGNMWRCRGGLGGKPAALALNLPGSIPGHSPFFRVAMALLLSNLLQHMSFSCYWCYLCPTLGPLRSQAGPVLQLAMCP